MCPQLPIAGDLGAPFPYACMTICLLCRQTLCWLVGDMWVAAEAQLWLAAYSQGSRGVCHHDLSSKYWSETLEWELICDLWVSERTSFVRNSVKIMDGHIVDDILNSYSDQVLEYVYSRLPEVSNLNYSSTYHSRNFRVNVFKCLFYKCFILSYFIMWAGLLLIK